MMRVLSRGGARGSSRETMLRLHQEPEFYTELDVFEDKRIRASAPALALSKAQPPKSATFLTVVWVLAIVFFGFGDTLTSMLVFGSGGVEGNGFMVLVLTMLTKTLGSLQAIWGFAAIKLLSTGAVVLAAQAQPRLLWPAGLAMLGLGMFLTAQNATVLMTL